QGLQLVTREVSQPKELPAALDSLRDQMDGFWIVPDEALLQQALVDKMLGFAGKADIPVLGLSDLHAEKGALLALYFASSEDIGRQAGELAQAIVGGRPAADLPYTTARTFKLAVNLKIAQKLGIRIPKEILDRATNVIQ